MSKEYDYDTAGKLYRVWSDDRVTMLENNEYVISRQRELSWRSNNNNIITWYAWGGSSVIAEYDGNHADYVPLVWKKSYVYAGSRLLSTFTNNGSGGETLEFHHPDRLGTKVITNNTANTSFEQSTLPFGTALDAETSGTTNQRFTSYDRSSVAQLDYAVNRSYSSGQGRFTSVDPIGMSATNLGNPQSMNLYAYVENNPIDYVDPSGLDIYIPEHEIGHGDIPALPPEKVEVIADNDPIDYWGWGVSDWFIPMPLLPMPEFSGGGSWEVDVTADSESVTTNTPTINASYTQQNDCLFFANSVDRFAKLFPDSIRFRRILVDFYNDWVNRDPSRRNARYSQFRSRGFKDEFTDEVGPGNSPNQVYHYVGVFNAGWWAGNVLGNSYLGYAVAIRVANEHETEYDDVLTGDGGTIKVPRPPTPSHAADMRLNGVAVWHGAQLGAGAIKPKDLGNLIRKDVCK